MSRHKGFELVFSGGIINVSQPEKITLVNRVYSRERLHEGTLEMASEIASKSAIVLKLIREAHYTMSDMECFKAIGYLREMIGLTASTKDCKEGITAFIAKRKPNWRGE